MMDSTAKSSGALGVGTKVTEQARHTRCQRCLGTMFGRLTSHFLSTGGPHGRLLPSAYGLPCPYYHFRICHILSASAFSYPRPLTSTNNLRLKQMLEEQAEHELRKARKDVHKAIKLRRP